MRRCTTSVVCVVLQLHHRREPEFSGIRSTNFGDVIFVDHAEIQLRKNKYMVLLVLDGATNLLWATAQKLTEQQGDHSGSKVVE